MTRRGRSGAAHLVLPGWRPCPAGCTDRRQPDTDKLDGRISSSQDRGR